MNNNGTIEIIPSTHSSASSTWTGTSSKINSLVKGTRIYYWLKKAPTSDNVTLNLTLANGSTTGAINVYIGNYSTPLTNEYPAWTMLNLLYDGTYWYVLNPIITDTALNANSIRPVQNTVINSALNGKVDKVSGKGLSTNDLTDARVHILDSVYEGARARKRPLGYLIESNRDTSNQPLIEINKGTKLKVRLYESELGNIITGKSNIIYPDGLGITYTIVRNDFATFGGNHLIQNGAEISINLDSGYYMMIFSFPGSDNFYPVYRTIILRVIE